MNDPAPMPDDEPDVAPCATTAVVDGAADITCPIPGGQVTTRYRGSGLLHAGSNTCLQVSIEADIPLPAGARFALARRWPSDWGTVQWLDASALNFAQAFASTAAPLTSRYARRHAWHPFDHALVVELQADLPPGATLGLRFGGVPGTCPGYQVQTFIEEASPLSVRLRTRPDGLWQEIARPAVRISGGAAAQLVATAPSQARANAECEIHVRAQDIWGNPASLGEPLPVVVYAQDQAVAHAALPAAGWVRIAVPAGPAGIRTFSVRTHDHPELRAESNPVRVTDGPPANLLVWGDLHAQSVIGCGARSIDDYFRHARDFAATDFSSHQANCFLVSQDEWQETQRSTQAAHEEQRFVTLLGVEWSAASRLGGDHNLYFPGATAELRRCSHQFVRDKSDIANDLPHVRDVYAHYAGSDTLIAVHVGGRTADLHYHDPTLERLLEVHSTHATSEWFLFDALRRGHRFGVVAGSDSVDGRPGASHPGRMGVRNVRGGLTAISMPALTRQDLWRALKSRHCYATTGERILLSFRTGTCAMGDTLDLTLRPGEPLPAFDVQVEGTAGIEALDFFRDDQLLLQHDFLADASHRSKRFRIGWRGASAQGNWERARMDWDGQLRITGAQIQQVEPWAFDTADEGISASDASHVAWTSITAGDWDGVVLTLDNADAAILHFETAPIQAQHALGTVEASGWCMELQAPWRMLEIRRLPAADPARQVRLSLRDAEAPAGRHAYWVRVRQVDGAYAWSTPIFLDITIG